MITLAFLFANLAGILTSIGLGGATLIAQLRAWLDTMKAFFLKSGQLRRSVKALRMEFEMHSPTDEACLDVVKDLLRNYMAALEEAVKVPKRATQKNSRGKLLN